ncbi:DNA excision repair protein ERCC-6-like [Diaphorina citri]|uniref:DNA excision repair protein ERCC-6-like n=1 Tax=Diaphorina citri TaxID=121845 RepID=A0A3Q0J030_DIACI|nr:DNA excision repair protein ERCC-6-like [Diaphorina citri]
MPHEGTQAVWFVDIPQLELTICRGRHDIFLIEEFDIGDSFPMSPSTVTSGSLELLRDKKTEETSTKDSEGTSTKEIDITKSIKTDDTSIEKIDETSNKNPESSTNDVTSNTMDRTPNETPTDKVIETKECANENHSIEIPITNEPVPDDSNVRVSDTSGNNTSDGKNTNDISESKSSSEIPGSRNSCDTSESTNGTAESQGDGNKRDRCISSRDPRSHGHDSSILPSTCNDHQTNIASSASNHHDSRHSSIASTSSNNPDAKHSSISPSTSNHHHTSKAPSASSHHDSRHSSIASTSSNRSDAKHSSISPSTSNHHHTSIESDSSSHSRHKKKKKKSRHRERDSLVDGEHVPYLVGKEKPKKEKSEQEVRQKQDDYILEKLFSKSNICTAMKHDKIMEEGCPDYVVVEKEAEEIAHKAIEAIQESRRSCHNAAAGIPTWTGNNGSFKVPTLLLDKIKKRKQAMANRQQGWHTKETDPSIVPTLITMDMDDNESSQADKDLSTESVEPEPAKPFQIDRNTIQAIDVTQEEGLGNIEGLTCYDEQTFEMGCIQQLEQHIHTDIEPEPAKPFQIDRNTIQAIDVTQEEGLGNIEGLTCYDEQTFEMGCIQQLEQHIHTDVEQCVPQWNKLQEEGETEQEAAVRLGEITPFGAILGRNTNIPKPKPTFRQKAIKRITRKTKRYVKENLGTETEENVHWSYRPEKKKKKKSRSRESAGLRMRRIVKHWSYRPGALPGEEGTIDFDEPSGSDYEPSADEPMSEDEEFEYDLEPPKPKKIKIKKERRSEDEEDSEGEWYSSDEESRRKRKNYKERDDGDEGAYQRRVRYWEKSRPDAGHFQEFHKFDFFGFKIPQELWEKLFKYQKVGVQWLYELNESPCGGLFAPVENPNTETGLIEQIIEFVSSQGNRVTSAAMVEKFRKVENAALFKALLTAVCKLRTDASRQKYWTLKEEFRDSAVENAALFKALLTAVCKLRTDASRQNSSEIPDCRNSCDTSESTNSTAESQSDVNKRDKCISSRDPRSHGHDSSIVPSTSNDHQTNIASSASNHRDSRYSRIASTSSNNADAKHSSISPSTSNHHHTSKAPSASSHHDSRHSSIASTSSNRFDAKHSSISPSTSNHHHTSIESGSSSHSRHKKKKKKSRHRERDSLVDGEHVPYLVGKEKPKKEKSEQEVRQKQDDYILEKLFSKSNICTAMKHDKIMEEGCPDYVVVEKEAEEIAHKAIEAIQESRRSCHNAAAGIPTWTGNNGSFKVPTLLLDKIKKRKQAMANRQQGGSSEMFKKAAANTETGLIEQIIEFVSGQGNRVTSAAMVEKFRKVENAALFKALLTAVCKLRTDASRQKYWTLKEEFRDSAVPSTSRS